MVVDTDNETVTYRQTIDYFFESELSTMIDKETGEKIQLDQEDRFNIANLPFIVSFYSTF